MTKGARGFVGRHGGETNLACSTDVAALPITEYEREDTGSR